MPLIRKTRPFWYTDERQKNGRRGNEEKEERKNDEKKKNQAERTERNHEYLARLGRGRIFCRIKYYSTLARAHNFPSFRRTSVSFVRHGA